MNDQKIEEIHQVVIGLGSNIDPSENPILGAITYRRSDRPVALLSNSFIALFEVGARSFTVCYMQQ